MENNTRNRLILATIAGAILLAPMAAWATTTQNFLSIKQGVVNTSPNKVDSAIFQTRAGIPKDGNHGAFGYGVITASGTVIVSTTHKGVLDSKTQGEEKDNPVFHNHYIQLKDEPKCGSNPGVNLDTITFGSPGKLSISGSNLQQANLPKSFEGLTQTNTLVDPKVVSFVLEAINVDPNGKPEAVCVTDIQPAGKIVER